MADGIQEGDLIIFNRCTDDTPKSKWRRAALAMNNTARIFFENTGRHAWTTACPTRICPTM